MNKSTTTELVSNEDLDTFVDDERGLISPHIFSSQEIYEQELDRVFGNSWLFLAHESQIRKAGDFFTTYMGADPILVVRQRDGSVGAFLNACRHRGMKVCRSDQGNAKAFTCTYHGWSYDTGGKLVNVPNLSDAYNNDLETSEWGLKAVPRLEIYRGMIFGCFEDSVPPLEEFLGEFKFYMDLFFDRTEGGVEMVGGVHKWKLKGNWKLAAEQFAGDSYHAQFSHVSDFSVVIPPAKDSYTEMLVGDYGRQAAVPEGHSAGFHEKGFPKYAETNCDPIIDEYEASIMDEIEARLGKKRRELSGGINGHYHVFPNLSWLGNHTFRVWHPKGPNDFECWSFIFVDKDAPDKVKDAIRLSTQNQFSAAGMAEQDDGENWGLIGSNFAGRGREIHKMSLNYSMAANTPRDDDPDLPGWILRQGFGEMPQRLFYRRWRELMKNESYTVPVPFEQTAP